MAGGGSAKACNYLADVFAEQDGVRATGAAVGAVSDSVVVAIGISAVGALKEVVGQACGGGRLCHRVGSLLRYPRFPCTRGDGGAAQSRCPGCTNLAITFDAERRTAPDPI
jgi:hypothetical protein